MITLNPAQQDAVKHHGGPALVLAGAGSGKTRVIVERLAWLVEEQGVDPRNLLALTFTNRAAREMRERVQERLAGDRFSAWVGTFHSFGLYLLRRNIGELGRKTGFSIFDDTDQLGLMKKLIKDLPTTFEKVSPREALWWISQHKQDLKEPNPDEFEDERDPAFAELWCRYIGTLERANAVDFDDILVLSAKLLRDVDGVREAYNMRYHHVLIDEYQDTNHAQYVIAKGLTASRHNLFVVGDEDQSIYSWRGATIRNILDFEADYDDAKTYRLEQNYRSTAPILAAANAVVANNTERLGKTLWTDQKTGAPVAYTEVSDGLAEADFVVDAIAKGAIPPSDTAVLYRTNGQARVMEEALRKKGLAYVMVGGTQFYSRKEIKDVLAYLRLLVNPDDDVALRRVINTPTRGIGGTTMAHLEAYATARSIPLFTVLRDVEHDESITARARNAIGEFVHLIDDLTFEARSESVADLLEALLDRTGYRDFVSQSDEKDFRTRLELLDEFASACAQFDKDQPEGDLFTFLQDLALLSDVDQWDPSQPAVTMMTCHSAKGLEFDQVFLIGLEEGLLPHASSLDSDQELEEERRLCYVAMTRARKRLVLTGARKRLIYGEETWCEPSRFLKEIPPGALEAEGDKPKPKKKPAAASTSDPGAYKMGTRVWHSKFGKGVVMYTKGSGPRMKARIRFQTGRTREFMVSAAPLSVLEGENK